MTQARKVVAAFYLITHPLTVSLTGNGTGTVTSNPAGISCPPTCSVLFTYGQSVTLSATAASGSTFAGWSGEGCSGTSTCTVNMTQARGVFATFTLQQVTLTVVKAGTGSGTVTSAPGGITCGATCSAPFDFGTSVTLTATASPGSTFTGWSGEGCSDTSTCTVSMTQARSVTATFNGTQLPQLMLLLNKAIFHQGDTLTLTARVTPGATPITADVYIALQLPGCTSPACALFWRGGMNFTATPQPILRNWLISPFDEPIFHYAFGGTEPVGEYVWLGAFVVPGTGNLIGGIVETPFSFSP